MKSFETMVRGIPTTQLYLIHASQDVSDPKPGFIPAVRKELHRRAADKSVRWEKYAKRMRRIDPTWLTKSSEKN